MHHLVEGKEVNGSLLVRVKNNRFWKEHRNLSFTRSALNDICTLLDKSDNVQKSVFAYF